MESKPTSSTSPRRAARRGRVPVAAVVAVLGILGVLGQPTPAAADGTYCGYRVLGAIEAKYVQTGGPGGPLGCPTSGELANPDGGRRTHFDRGSIYWSSATGAHEVRGAIHAKWAAMGWEAGALGYPISDEIVLADGIGRRSTFQRGSIYWSPTSGAFSIWGEIGRAWGTMGWEAGRLGYPISDEIRSADGVGVYSEFQAGTIYWGQGFTCTVDGRAVPFDKQRAAQFVRETGQRRCGEAWRNVQRVVVGGRYTVPNRVDFVLCGTPGDCPGVADASAGDRRIRVNHGYVQDQPADWGMVAHELTHIVQGYRGDRTGWVTESVADWTRYTVGQPPPSHPGSQPQCTNGRHYTEGYECGAAFLTYLDNRDPGALVPDLNVFMRQQTTNADVDGWLRNRTGHSVAALWAACRTTTCAGGRG